MYTGSDRSKSSCSTGIALTAAAAAAAAAGSILALAPPLPFCKLIAIGTSTLAFGKSG